MDYSPTASSTSSCPLILTNIVEKLRDVVGLYVDPPPSLPGVGVSGRRSRSWLDRYEAGGVEELLEDRPRSGGASGR